MNIVDHTNLDVTCSVLIYARELMLVDYHLAYHAWVEIV